MCKICGKEFEPDDVVIPLFRWGINCAAPGGYIHAYHVDDIL